MNIAVVEPELPYGAGFVRLYSSATTEPLPDAADCHAQCPYFLEIRGLMGGEGMFNLGAAVHVIEIWSGTCIEPQMRVSYDGHTTSRWRERDFGAPWGHYDDVLSSQALDAVLTYGPRVAQLGRTDTFNPLSNALRLYYAGLRLLPSDVALVTFISALEAIFTTSERQVSARFRRGVGALLGSDPASRQACHDHARDLYAWRSKVVHGNQLDEDGEQTAIMLSEDLTPAAERLCRRTFRKIFEERLDTFLETDAACVREQLYALLWNGTQLNTALATLGVVH